MVLNVKNRARAKCFEIAQEGLGPWVTQVESILVYYEKKTWCKKALCCWVLPLKNEEKKDDVLLLTSSLVCWEHNVKSCQPLLHLTETNPLKGLPLPAWRLYTLFTPGFPLTVRGYTRQVDWRLLVPEFYEWKCAIFNLFSTSTVTKREC